MHTTDLPEGYRLVHSIDLQKNKKSALLVNIGGLAIAAAMIVPAAFFAPISDLFSLEGPPYALLTKTAVLFVGTVLYLFLHEWTHGVFMKHYSGVKPKYGFTGLYAYTGSTAFFGKRRTASLPFPPSSFWGFSS